MNMIIKIWHYDNIKNYIKRSTLCESIVRVGLLLVKEMYIGEINIFKFLHIIFPFNIDIVVIF